ncbi:MAG: hypothetical protein AB7I19_08360 [Planctomycetota bacterium]
MIRCLFLALVSSLTGLCATSTSLSAQGAARFLPRDAIVSFSMFGPRAFGDRTAETNLGRLLADPAAAPIRELPAKMLDKILAEIGDSRAETHLRGAYEFFGGYGGRISCAARFAMDADAENADEALGELLVGIVFEPDGETDFAAFVESVREAANDAELEQRLIGTEANGFTLVQGENRKQFVLPRVIDGHLVCYYGLGLEDALARLGEQSSGEEPAADESLLHLRVELDRLMGIVISSLAGIGGRSEIEPELLEVIDRRIGLKQFDLRFRTDGEFLRADYSIVADPERSILDLLQPNAKSTPIAALAPSDHENWSSVRLDLGWILNFARDLVMEARGEDVFELLEQVSSEFGVDVRHDLFGAFDGQLLLLNDSLAGLEAMAEGDEDEDAEVAGLYSGVIGLRDAKAFESTLEKLLRSRGLHAARKTTEYRGVAIRTMNVAIVQFSYAIVNEGIAFGVGKIGVDSVRSIVDASLAATDGQRQIRFPEPFAERRRRIGDDWRDFQISSSAGYAGILKDVMAGELEDLDDPVGFAVVNDIVMPALEAWLELAPRFDLERSLSAMRLVPGRLEIVSIQ